MRRLYLIMGKRTEERYKMSYIFLKIIMKCSNEKYTQLLSTHLMIIEPS